MKSTVQYKSSTKPYMRLQSGIIVMFLAVLALNTHPVYAQDDMDYTEVPFWRQALGGAVIGRPAAQAESVVMTTDGGNLKSYSWQGRPLWDYYARGRLTPYVSRSREGTSYICRTNGLLIAVNRVGRELWQINLNTPLTSPVLIGWDGRLFVFTDDKITCLTAAGYALWSKSLGKKTVLAPIRDTAGGIILVMEDGEVRSFDPFGNVSSYTAINTVDTASGVSANASNAPKGVPAAAASLEIDGWGHSILLLYENRRLELAYTALGAGEFISLELPSPPLAAVGKNNEAAVVLKNGQVALLSLAEKKILWTGASHIRAGELPDKPGLGDLDIFYDERGIYVLTKTGATGFTSDGRRLWITRLKGAASIPSFGDDGVLYSGGADWILYAYRLEDRVKSVQRVLYGEAPEGSYGTGNPGPSSWADYYFRFSENELERRLGEIRQAIKNGTVGSSEKDYAAWLMETAGSFAANPRTGNHPPVQARYRSDAARLLAFIGSRETIPFLADLFTRDTDPLVKAAAAEAIGKIGVDPDGLALKAFENALVPPLALTNEVVLTAIAGSAGALCRFSGPPLSDAGIRILTLLSTADKPPPTRRQAERELKTLGR